MKNSFGFVPLLLTICIAAFTAPSCGQIAPTPPIGWNSWNKFAAKIAGHDILILRLSAIKN